MSVTCKYCFKLEDKQNQPGLMCDKCDNFVHLSCLRSLNTPGNFAGDVFFDFTCESCSPDQNESLRRNKFQWVNVLILTMNHLQNEMHGISNRGFFHYKTHICSFIDRNWLVLFGPNFKRTKNWLGTIVGALSVYNSFFFRSGTAVLGELGWWKLKHSFSPAVAAHIIQELGRDKPKRVRNQMSIDTKLFTKKVTEMGYSDYFIEEEYEHEEPAPCKKPRLHSDDYSATAAHEHMDSDTKSDIFDTGLFTRDSISEVENIFHGFDYASTSHMPSDSSSAHSYRPPYDSDSHSSHPPDVQSDDERSTTTTTTVPAARRTSRKNVEFKRESLFSTQLNSVDSPWEEPQPEVDKELVEMTEYEEIQLLKRVEVLVPRAKDPSARADLLRLRAKLVLRRRKRHNHQPLFDIDRAVKLLGGYMTDDPKVAVNAERILDRFQRSFLMDRLCGTVSSTSGPLLVSRAEPSPLRSAYSGVLLKPYIRRDATSMPTWLKVTDELLRKTNKCPGYRSPRATIDYSYVQPHHIAAVNNLCAQFFWPGIDLTEALQYPEFSCVVTYKRLVVACAFLVPDVRPAEAYVSFVLTRPEWRNAKIASFMLYHLLQTCTGKDVTLHVSPTNPAIFLYQKFGFKVEELIQDFYEKYYDIDYKGCRHALFLRLTR